MLTFIAQKRRVFVNFLKSNYGRDLPDIERRDWGKKRILAPLYFGRKQVWSNSALLSKLSSVTRKRNFHPPKFLCGYFTAFHGCFPNSNTLKNVQNYFELSRFFGGQTGVMSHSFAAEPTWHIANDFFRRKVNIFNTTTTNSPKADGLNAMQSWVICCIFFVFGALFEYAIILLQMKIKTFRKVAASMQKDETCAMDVAVLIAFPVVFLIFNIVYWAAFHFWFRSFYFIHLESLIFWPLRLSYLHYHLRNDVTRSHKSTNINSYTSLCYTTFTFYIHVSIRIILIVLCQ